ncbi:MAG: hypothetical protein RL539_403, partial [Pseudomonadota bacterium]
MDEAGDAGATAGFDCPTEETITTGGTLLDRSTMGAGVRGEEHETSPSDSVMNAIPRALGNKAKAALGVPTCTLLSLQTVFVIDL